MLRNLFWWATILAAAAAIVAGYVNGRITTHVPAPADRARRAPAPRAAVERAPVRGGSVEGDPFARDEVVVDRVVPVAPGWHRERLIVAVVGLGRSMAVESACLQSGLPLLFVIDPGAPNARAAAALARAQGRIVYLQVGAAPSAVRLTRLRAAFGPLDGLASRSAAGMPAALRGSGLSFFDERGNADPGAFARAGVRLLQRDVTADDRPDPGYIAFMLDRAAERSQRLGTTVVLVRPLPTTLAALRHLQNGGVVRIVAPPR